ncbi:hypothetical protein L5515_006366 [Caenorhabditis briggsae]|uniref:Uncharacterized protein n=1 Tax=Caenorhabditis briggsae TaxID=6238 RepID=A0AAE9F1E7_CAEBR|nr:hypothetical protein L5515_006366 [Caenorhabditis briggsae]
MRFREKRFLQLLLYLISLLHLSTPDVIFTVEDEGNQTTPSRHLHKLRHSRGSSSSSPSTPYLTASSSVINPRDRLESFSLNCPHVVDSSNKNVHIEVVWTLNETVWLKIENGHQRVVHGESTFNKRRVSGKTVMRLLLNNARYLFDYDELTGDFSMEISPVLWSTDCGAWQCHVTVRQPNGKSHTLTSRRRIKPGEIGVRKETRRENVAVARIEPTSQPEQVEFGDLLSSAPIQLQKRGDRSSDWGQNVASFSRNSDDNVYMTRKSEEISTNVVFARNDGPIRKHHHHNKSPVRHRELERLFDAQIDYELDMSTDDMYYLGSRAHARSAQYYYNGVGTTNHCYAYLPIFSTIFVLFL